MTERERALHDIRPGDLFHVDGDHGYPIPCLATALTDTTILARSITHQMNIEFDRRTGIGKGESFGLGGKIASTAALPPDIHRALMGLDHRYRTTDPGPLSKAELRALVFIDDFYPANPLPP